MFDRNGLDNKSGATVEFPAQNSVGRTIGAFHVSATCNTEILSINATLANAPSYEIPQIGPQYSAQVPHRSAYEITLNSTSSGLLMSMLDRANSVSVDFTAPGFDKLGGEGGLIVAAKLLNGDKFVGAVSDLYAASIVRITIPVKHSSSVDAIHFTFNPQSADFQAYATSCKELQPGSERDPRLVLADRADEATKWLPTDEASKLRSIIAAFEDGLKTNSQLVLNDASTHLTNLSAFGAEKRCTSNDKRSCNAVEAMRDVHDAMVMARRATDDKRRADTVANNTSIPAKTALQITLPQQTDISSSARGAQVTGQLAVPITKGTTIVFERGTAVHLSVSALGVPPRQLIGSVTEILRNGAFVPISTTQCVVNITTDSVEPSAQRPRREPGQPPFRPVPRSPSPSSHIAAGSICSVETVGALMK